MENAQNTNFYASNGQPCDKLEQPISSQYSMSCEDKESSQKNGERLDRSVLHPLNPAKHIAGKGSSGEFLDRSVGFRSGSNQFKIRTSNTVSSIPEENEISSEQELNTAAISEDNANKPPITEEIDELHLESSANTHNASQVPPEKNYLNQKQIEVNICSKSVTTEKKSAFENKENESKSQWIVWLGIGLTAAMFILNRFR